MYSLTTLFSNFHLLFPRILVGAPEDQLYSAYEYNVTRPGAVYRCEPGYRNYAAEGNVRTLDRCTPMIFDKNPSKC